MQYILHKPPGPVLNNTINALLGVVKFRKSDFDVPAINLLYSNKD